MEKIFVKVYENTLGFNHAHHLQNHEKVHTKETPFLCNECGKGFAVKYNLKVHMRRHSNEKPYSCLQCEKAFAHRSALMTHTRTHSGMKYVLIRRHYYDSLIICYYLFNR